MEDITFNYNNSINRSIKTMPEDVNEENADKVWLTLYGDMKAGGEKKKFQLGDVVRVEKYYARTRFEKGYQKYLKNELFVISAVYRGYLNMYEIQDIDT